MSLLDLSALLAMANEDAHIAAANNAYYKRHRITRRAWIHS